MCPCKEPGDEREAVRDRQTKVSRQFILGSRDCMTKFHIQLGLLKKQVLVELARQGGGEVVMCVGSETTLPVFTSGPATY